MEQIRFCSDTGRMDNQRIHELEQRVTAIEERLRQASERKASASQHRPAVSQPDIATVAPQVRPPARQPTGPPPPPHFGPAPEIAIPELTSPNRLTFSVQTSETLLKWAGLGLVVLAVVFALGLAIERGWITPQIRVLAATLVALGLLGSGQRLRKSRPLFSDSLQGTGFVVGYLTALSTLVMDLVDGPVGLTLMVAVTLLALGTSLVVDSPPIAVLGVLGGFATPLLLELQEASFLTGYVPLLAVAGWAVFAWTGWRTVALSTAAAAWVLLAPLVLDSQSTAVVVSVVSVGLLSWLVPLVRSLLVERGVVGVRESHYLEAELAPILEGTSDRLTYLAPLATLALLIPVLDLTRYQWSPVVGGTAALFGMVAAALWATDFKGKSFVHITMAALLGSVAITLALDGDVLLVSLAMQMVVLSLIGDRLGHRPMIWQGRIMFAIAILAVAGRGAIRGDDWVPELGPELAEWLAELIVLALAAWKAATDPWMAKFGTNLVHLVTLGWLYTVLAEPWIIVSVIGLYLLTKLVHRFESIDLEVGTMVNGAVLLAMTAVAGAGHYSQELDYDAWRVLLLAGAVVALAVGAWFAAERTREVEIGIAYVGLLAWIPVVAGTSDPWITAGWVTIGLAILAAGVRLSSSEAQVVGWLTVGGASAKLLLHDLEAVDPLVRIGLFFGIGVAFLGLAYLLPTHLAPARPEQTSEQVPASSVQ